MSQGLSLRWVRKREPHWRRLEELIASCGRRGVRALRHQDLRELALLYRQTAADLATARAESPTSELSRELNQLLGRAHNLVYAALPTERHPIWRFYVHGFPAIFRTTWRYTAAAALLLVAGAGAGVLLCWSEPGFERFVLGSAMIDTIERHEMWTQSVLAMKPVASSGIMTNNLAVSLTACATGILAGLGTVYMMTFNGLLLGVVATACHRAGMDVSLWSFVAPHGALELPSIAMAGGAGLILARAVLAPGDASRRDALTEAGGRTVRLLLGVVPLLIVAGVIEGFISPTLIPPPLKFLMGGALFTLLVLYLLVLGERAPATAAPAP